MGIDFSRVATSALQSALENSEQSEPKQHRRRLTAGKAIVAGAAVAIAAKYAVDKTSGLRGKGAMAALRNTARNTLGDLVPESLHDELLDSGFFDDEDEEFDGSQGSARDSLDEPEDDEPRDEGGAQRAADAAPANGRADTPGVMDVLNRAPRRPRRRQRSSGADPAE